MRQIVLDTETTGLDPAAGHRVIELGCVEIVNRRLSGRRFQRYLNPERDIDAGAREVHGLDAAFLADKPRFADVVQEFLEFVQGTELIIHNAAFDVGFLDHELTRIAKDLGKLSDYCTVLDTLALARRLHPGQKNNLDALCKRYSVDNTQRQHHGALLDAEILAEVYLAMSCGQDPLALDVAARPNRRRTAPSTPLALSISGKIIRANAAERAQHAAWLDALDKAYGSPCVWNRLARGTDPGTRTGE